MKFDEEFLKEMGLENMPEEQKGAFLEYAQEELEVRVGEKISEGMPDEKMDEFDKLEDQALITEWLEKNRPDYKEVVQNVIDDLKKEILDNRDAILAG